MDILDDMEVSKLSAKVTTPLILQCIVWVALVLCGLNYFKINIMHNKTSDALFLFAFNITYKYASIQKKKMF